jgi:hypothetical protein
LSKFYQEGKYFKKKVKKYRNQMNPKRFKFWNWLLYDAKSLGKEEKLIHLSVSFVSSVKFKYRAIGTDI